MDVEQVADRFFNKCGFAYSLKPLQKAAISHLLNSKNVFCVLPTGFGKSDIFGWFSGLKCEASSSKGLITLVISPLRALSQNQASRWNAAGITAAVVDRSAEMDSNTVRNMKDGQIQVIFSSPEAILDDKWKDVVKELKERVCLLVIDEAHCVELWGSTFRSSYKRIRELRAILGNKVPVLCLTATATPAVVDGVKESLGITDIVYVVSIPNRPNIFLSVQAGEAGEKELRQVVLELTSMEDSAPKTVVFCRSIDSVLKVYHQIMLQIEEIEKEDCESFIDLYHGQLDATAQKRITDEFCKDSSTIRLLISTIAFGMGVQVNDISHVIHWGPPSTVSNYWQEVGRCARDGRAGKASMFLPPRSVDRRTVSEDMIRLVTEKVCIRKYVLHKLDVGQTASSDIEACCGSTICCSRCIDI